MALIPLNQYVTLYKQSGNELDEWGNPIPADPVVLDARVDEGTFVTNDKESYVTGKVVVAQVRVLLDGLADISYDDELEFVNELGQSIRRKPLKITIKRDFFGNPNMTEVML